MNTYKIKRNNDWNDIEPLYISNFMGEKPSHIPITSAKLRYDNKNLYIKYEVKDQFVRAQERGFQDSVCKDSCVEFFFTTAEQYQKYFNLEINCVGNKLFCIGEGRANRERIDKDRYDLVITKPSLQGIIDPEIPTPITWTLDVILPFCVLSNKNDFPTPKKGDIWRANFYKCADETSHPHWLTWNVVEKDEPDFHQPSFFGRLIFD